MSKNRNKININSLTEQLDNIVEEYNNIDFDISLNQPSVVSLENKLSLLNQENQFLENEIRLLKNYISQKIESLNNENRFESIFNKFLEYYKSGKYSPRELMKKFSQYVEKQFSGELIDTFEFDKPENLSTNENLSVEKIENAFESALDEIRKIQSSKNSFLSKIISEQGLSYSSTDKILHSVFQHLDGIENKLFSQIQKVFYDQKDILANSYQLENFNVLKNNVLNVISDNINNLKNEFINFVSFNKYLDKKIDNFRHTAPESFTTNNTTPRQDFFGVNNNEDKFENLEAKVNTLINVINDLKNNDSVENFDQLIRTTTNSMVEEKFLALEDKLTKLIKDLDEKNSKILENQNTSKGDVDVEKLIDTIKTSITEENKNFISKIIENNLNEKKDILSLLKRIQKQSEQKNNDYEMESKQVKNSQKLLELEHLILRQNDEIESLLREKNDALFEIENILNSQQKKAITQETLDSIQKSIVDIADSFNSKINYLETSLATKLDDLNLSANISDEISRNIGNVENRLLQNYENIKTNFNTNLEEIKNKLDDTTITDDLKFKMNDILSVVTDVKDSNNYANIERILDTKTSEVIDKKIIELETKFNEILNMMNENNKNSIDEDRKETKKLISNFEEILETLKQEKNDLIESVNINNEKILSRTEHESQLILDQFSKFLEDMKSEKEQSKHEYESLINAVISNNQNEKRQIMKLIDKLENEGTGIDSQRAIENSKKLTQLEYLILRQNDELESLLNEKEITLDALEKVLSSKHDNANLIDNIQASISQISGEFNEKISELEKNFAEKLDGLNLNSSNLSDEMSRSIANIETRLLQNYETIKNSFNASLEEIQHNLDNNELVESLKYKMNDILSVVNDVKDSNNYANIERILDSKTSEVLDKKIIELEDKFNEVINVINKNNEDQTEQGKAYHKQLVNSFEEIVTSLKRDKEEFIDSINSNNENIIRKSQEESRQLLERMENLVEALKIEKEESKIEHQNFFSNIVMNNENEKKYIISLLKKVENNILANGGLNEQRAIENNRKLAELDYLILKQNDEIESLLADKQDALETIEKIINDNRKEILNSATLDNVRDSILDIAQTFEVRINNLEKSFNKEFRKLNIKSLGEQLNSDRENINSNINNLENKLISNYEQIKDNINESFESILSSINSSVKDNGSLYEITNFLDKKFDKLEYFYKDIDSKNELFKNEIVERIQEFVNRSSDSNVLNAGLDRIEEMLNNSLIQIQEAAENSYEKIDSKISKLDQTTGTIAEELRQQQTVFDNLCSKLLNNFDKYEELLIKSLDKDRRNYEELKLIISNHFHKKEQELNEAELSKLESLNKKLDNLVDLIDLQEQEINSLVQEKDEVIKKLNNSLKKNDFTTEEIENISSIIEEKINLCLKRILESPENISNFFLSNNNQNEFAQVNDKIDELSKYVHDNIEIHKNNSSFKDLVKLESYRDAHNLDFVFDKLTNIQKDLLNILKTDIDSLDKDGIVKIQKDISAFKFNLLNIQDDVILLKAKINSNVISDNYVDEQDFREIVEINNKKISIIEEIIEKNNNILSNLYAEKEKIISKTESDLTDNFEIKDNDNLEIILEAKANTVIDKIVDEIKRNQSQEISRIESRFKELESKIDNRPLNNEVFVDEELKNKISSLEEAISNSFKSLTKVNEDLVNYLDERLNENDNSFNQIVKKFEEGKQEIRNEIIAQSNSLRQQMKMLNNDEIELYKAELENYTNQLKKAQSKISELEVKYQNANNEVLDKDRIILSQEFKLEHIEELIDNLNLQIDSFVEEKNELINMMTNKLDYLGKLEAPEKGEFIELETNNLETNKFQKIIVDETSNMIQEKFKELKDNFEDYANEIKLTFDAINKEQNELTNNQITNKKENDENILTIENRLKNIEKIIFKNENSDSNSDDKNLELQKINQYDDNTLKLLNDNILFYVDELERRKKEIEIFYKKIRSLKNYLDNKSN